MSKQSSARASDAQRSELDAKLRKEFAALQTTSAYQKMQATRRALPAFAQRGALVDAIAKHNVVVIVGQTGCGKSTQVAQYVLDDFLASGRGTSSDLFESALTRVAGSACSMLCTQPRRLAAIGVAERVAAERGEACGQTVGYAIRLVMHAHCSFRSS